MPQHCHQPVCASDCMPLPGPLPPPPPQGPARKNILQNPDRDPLSHSRQEYTVLGLGTSKATSVRLWIRKEISSRWPDLHPRAKPWEEEQHLAWSSLRRLQAAPKSLLLLAVYP